MPIYEYHCRSCHQEFEQLVRTMCAKVDMICPQCGGKEVERKLSVFAAKSAEHSACDSEATRSCASCCDPTTSCPMRSGGH